MGLVSVLTRWVPRTVLQSGAHLALQSVAWTYAGSTLEDQSWGSRIAKCCLMAVFEVVPTLWHRTV